MVKTVSFVAIVVICTFAIVGLLTNNTLLKTVVQLTNMNAESIETIDARNKMLLGQEEDMQKLRVALEESVALCTQLQREIEEGANVINRLQIECAKKDAAISDLRKIIELLRQDIDPKPLEPTPTPAPNPAPLPVPAPTRAIFFDYKEI